MSGGTPAEALAAGTSGALGAPPPGPRAPHGAPARSSQPSPDPRVLPNPDEEGVNAIKIILLGDSAVGKSKLIERFLVRGEAGADAGSHRGSRPARRVPRTHRKLVGCVHRRRAVHPCARAVRTPTRAHAVAGAPQMNDYQPRQLSTYALTLFRYDAEVNGEKVAVDFWDTAGQARAAPPPSGTQRPRSACARAACVFGKAGGAGGVWDRRGRCARPRAAAGALQLDAPGVLPHGARVRDVL
eukprot:3755186-Prymnesium_polylepis.1